LEETIVKEDTRQKGLALNIFYCWI